MIINSLYYFSIKITKYIIFKIIYNLYNAALKQINILKYYFSWMHLYECIIKYKLTDSIRYFIYWKYNQEWLTTAFN
jgi:hypothetical protein